MTNARGGSTNKSKLPTYAELRSRTDAPPGASWGLFGSTDQIGTVNLLDSEAVLRAVALVKRGTRFNLDYALDEFQPPISPYRRAHQHVIDSRHNGQIRDDHLGDFYLQASSQIDGLRHHRHKVYGFYNYAADDEIEVGTATLGIQHVAQTGIVGRGVVVDVERYLAECGRPIDLSGPYAISVADLDGAAAAQGVRFLPGDVLLLNTGWARHFRNDLSYDERAKIIKERRFCGLEQSHEILEWIWDNHFSVVASDTVAVEVRPCVDGSPFADSVERLMHPDLIALLGVTLGELWKLDELAADCAADGVYECMVVSKPLNLVGGVGSPANALALK